MMRSVPPPVSADLASVDPPRPQIAEPPASSSTSASGSAAPAPPEWVACIRAAEGIEPGTCYVVRQRGKASNGRSAEVVVYLDDDKSRFSTFVADHFATVFGPDELPAGWAMSRTANGAMVWSHKDHPPVRLVIGQAGSPDADLGFVPGQFVIDGTKLLAWKLTDALGIASRRERAIAPADAPPPSSASDAPSVAVEPSSPASPTGGDAAYPPQGSTPPTVGDAGAFLPVPARSGAHRRVLDVADRALAHFGVEHRIQKMLEEMLELGVELTHLRDGKGSRERVISELGDVQFVLLQLIAAFDHDAVLSSMVLKADTLAARMDREPTTASSFEARLIKRNAELERRLRAIVEQAEHGGRA